MQKPLFRSLWAAACWLLIVFVALPALGQGPPQGGPPTMGGPGMRGPAMGGPGMGFRMMRGTGLAMLLGVEQVQKEIKLTEEQKAELAKLQESFRPPARGNFRNRWEELMKLSEEERNKKIEEMQKQFEEQAAKRDKEITAKLGEILQPEQSARLNQIEMQITGERNALVVLMRPEVMEGLGLSDEQKDQLKKIEEEIRAQWQQRPRGGRRGDRRPRRGGPDAGDQAEGAPGAQRGERPQVDWDKVRQQMREAREKNRAKAMAVLTPEQKAKLGEMMGEPFELDWSALRRGGGGPFGPPRGEGRRGRGPRGGGQEGGRTRGEQL